MEKTILNEIQDAGITTVNAGWRTFTIVYKEYILYDGHSHHGLCDWDTCCIYFRSGMDKDLARETVIHELTHIILETHGLGGSIKEDISVKNEEATTLISRGLMQLCALNPELMSIVFSSLIEPND